MTEGDEGESWESGSHKGEGGSKALPIDNKGFVGSLLIAHRTCPRRLLLVHLEIKRSIEALQMGTGEGAAWDSQAHLPELMRAEVSRENLALVSLGTHFRL